MISQEVDVSITNEQAVGLGALGIVGLGLAIYMYRNSEKAVDDNPRNDNLTTTTMDSEKSALTAPESSNYEKAKEAILTRLREIEADESLIEVKPNDQSSTEKGALEHVVPMADTLEVTQYNIFEWMHNDVLVLNHFEVLRVLESPFG